MPEAQMRKYFDDLIELIDKKFNELQYH